MSFLRNTWYCAGWSKDLGKQPKAITLLNEAVVLYRKTDGSPAALEDRCPHRYAPLSLGKITGDNLACGYHGLIFDEHGSCVHNPQREGVIPRGCSVKAYTIHEQQGVLWIWMGEPEQATINTVPDIGDAAGGEGWATINGTLKVDSHYEMVSDNLLDLGHVPYLHSFLAPGAELPDNFKEVRRLQTDGDRVSSIYSKFNSPVSPLFKMLWDEAPDFGELRGHMHWQPPSILLLDAGFTYMDSTPDAGVSLPQAHLLTPETETSTHYFWTISYNRKIDDEATSKQLRTQVNHVFLQEDEPMIAACANNMAGTDLLATDPVFLPGDAAAISARRKLTELIAAESATATAK